MMSTETISSDASSQTNSADTARASDASGGAAPSAEAALSEPAQTEAASEPAGAEVASDTSGEPSAEASESEHEGEAAEEGEAEAGTAQTSGDKPKKKRRRKKRKHPAAAGGETREGAPRPQHRASDRAPFHTGEEVFGKVTAVLETAIMVDLSGKALAIFDRGEMEADDLVPAVGDRFVARVHNDGLRGGLVVLTRKPLREEEAKPKVEQAAKDGTLIHGLITGVIKGGVEVDIDGLRAFAPASGMDLHPANANFAVLVGSRLDFKVVQYEKAGRDVVVSRRPMLEAEAHERRKHALTLLQEGQVMNGVVRTVVEWGAFVALPDAENLEGLVHASEASHDARTPLTELFRPGDRIEVKITKIDERGKIWLSRKALIEDPWAQAKQKYAHGSVHQGKVVRLEKFGAFVELEPGVEGLIHVSDLSLERIEHPEELLKLEQELDVLVHHFDPRSKKLTLHPAPTGERANEAPQKIVRNALVKAEVVKGEATGVLVRMLGVTGRAARGYIPGAQTGTQRGTDLRKAFKPGTVLDLKVIDLDPRSGEPKLSVRGFKEDEERRAHKEYRQKLKAEGGFGTLGDLLKARLGATETK
ncbi:MAG TPA: S1 RNA-binding domain-containing protein [Polyangiaceae bacterium]|jgi:small subunit ribosomal protein S1|nr:S1 RNA-binding domain-containing protein [Polyangiaceae bacterium]